jgi:hypothetical protein
MALFLSLPLGVMEALAAGYLDPRLGRPEAARV